MPSTRLIVSAFTACLLTTPAFAQNSMGTYTPSTQSGGVAAPSTPMTAGQTRAGTMGQGSMAPGSMAPGSMAPGSMSSAMSGYRQITPSSSTSIIAELQASGEFTILLKALAASNLTTLISTHNNLTLLAPTDTAFNALPPSQLASLMQPANAAQLQALLTYHLINALVKPADVEHHAAGPVSTVANKPVTFDGSGPVLKINTAIVLQAGVPASNGAIYAIDKVLTPPA